MDTLALITAEQCRLMSTPQKIVSARKLLLALDPTQDSNKIAKTLEAFATWTAGAQWNYIETLQTQLIDRDAIESLAEPIESSSHSESSSNLPATRSANGSIAPSHSASANDAMSLMFNPAMLANAIAPHLRGIGVDASQVEAIIVPRIERLSEKLSDDIANTNSDVNAIAGRIEAIEKSRANLIEVKANDSQAPSFSGLAHKQFSKLLALVNAAIPVWIYGGAGNGKTKAIADVAQALTLDYTNQVLPELCDPSELFGYRSVTTGEYIASLFRQRYELGGIYHLSEACNTSVSLLTSLNNAIENSSYSFPDKVVKRHPLFRVVFDDNTNGQGSANGYKRNSIDVSTRNRFAMFEWEHDLALEKALCANLASSLGVESDKLATWHNVLMLIRATIKSQDMALLCTMRDAMRGVSLFALGFSIDEVLHYATLGALTQDDRDMLKAGMRS